MIIDNIKNIFINESYSINLTKNKIYITNYEKLLSITDKQIILKFNDFNLNIKGLNFKIIKMLDKEILFNGHIESMEYIYNQFN